MKKNNITQLIILLLPNILWFTSCYEDKSSFVTNLIPEVQISINDKNQENSIYVGYQSPVDIVPSITQDGFDGSNLRYEWAVTEEPSTNNPVYEIIGTEKDFHGIINRPISNGAYTLKLTVTDVANDNLQYIYSWELYVQSSFLDGLLIADSENGTTTDFTLINNSQITNQYTKEERIFRHILETANGAAYDELLTSLTYEVMGNTAILGSSHLNQIWAISSTGKSIREKLEAIDQFHPARMADRILGMGDIVSLVERAQEQYDEEEAKRLQKKIAKNQFDFNDFLSQIAQIKKMGNLKDLASMIPGVGKAIKDIDIDDNAFKSIEAIIYSMTPAERSNPEILNGSRRTRIAKGSGTTIQEVNRLLKQFDQTRKMMKMVTSSKMGKMMPKMKR